MPAARHYFCRALRARIRLTILDRESSKPVVKEVRENDVYMGEIPLMTQNGSFIINGTERVIVSQLHRSPGVFFEHDRGKTHSSGKLLFSARIIPYRGSWLDFEFDPKDLLYFRIDRRRKMPVTTLLKALGYSEERILSEFYDTDSFRLTRDGVYMAVVPERLRGEVAKSDIVAPDGRVLAQKDKRITAKTIRDIQAAGITEIEVPADTLLGKVLARTVIHPETGEIIARANNEITEETLAKFAIAEIETVDVLFVNELDHGAYIAQTMRSDDVNDQLSARVAIYRMMRPGEPPTEDAVEALFQRLFFNEESYDLSRVGRMKFNRRAYAHLDDKAPGWIKRFYERVGERGETGPGTLDYDDIVAVIMLLVEMRNGRGEVDDIDHLATVACVRSANWPKTSSAPASCVSSALSRNA